MAEPEDIDPSVIGGLLRGLIGLPSLQTLQKQREDVERKQRLITWGLRQGPDKMPPDMFKLLVQGATADPEKPRAKGIRGKLGRQSGEESPLDKIVDKLMSMPATSQPGVMSMQMPGGPPPQRGQAQQAQGPMDQGSPGGQPVSTVPGRPQELPMESTGRGQAIPHRMSEAEQPFAQGPGEQRQPGLFYSEAERNEQLKQRMTAEDSAKYEAVFQAIDKLPIPDDEKSRLKTESIVRPLTPRTSEFKPISGTMPDGTKRTAFLDSALGQYIDPDTHQPLRGFVPDAKSISTHEDDMQRWVDTAEEIAKSKGKPWGPEQVQAARREYNQSHQQPISVYMQKANIAEDIALEKKAVDAINKNKKIYDDSRSTEQLMTKWAPEALAGNQQAMTALLNFHIAMTMRLPGVVSNRLGYNQALIEDAMKSDDFTNRVLSRIDFSRPDWRTGITLTPNEINQMVTLGRDKVKTNWDQLQQDLRENQDAIRPEVAKKNFGRIEAPRFPPSRDGSSGSGKTIHMRKPNDSKDPEGKGWDVPADKVEVWKKNGYTPVQQVQ